MKEMMLKDLPKNELPRERLLSNGVSGLSNQELISIILRTGTRSTSVKTLADDILSNCTGIEDLKNLTINKLETIKGLGDAKACSILAALELGKRVYEGNKITTGTRILSSLDAFRYCAKYINDKMQEHFMVIYLDNQKRYIKHKVIFIGTLNQSIVHVREVFKEAFLESASSIIAMHNHPSGDLVPSKSDDITTRALAETGNIMGIPLLDHIIVSKSDYYSYLESGKLKYE